MVKEFTKMAEILVELVQQRKRPNHPEGGPSVYSQWILVNFLRLANIFEKLKPESICFLFFRVS